MSYLISQAQQNQNIELKPLKNFVSVNSSQTQTNVTKSLNNIPQEPKINLQEMHNDIISLEGIKIEYQNSLKDILLVRNYTFKKEFIHLPFEMTTEVLYKQTKSYTLYPFLKLSRNTLLVLEKNKKKTNIENIFNKNCPILNLNFNQCSASFRINPSKCKIIIKVLSTNVKIFKLKIPNNNHEIFKNLVYLLYNAIITSRGYRTNLLGITLKDNFWKNYYMHYTEFQTKAKTGDILIFRGFECPAKIQRFYTRSEYDHVALLIRNNGVLQVYEATSKEGCKIRPWEHFIMYLWNLLYDKIVYRELEINIENEKTKKELYSQISKKADQFVMLTQKKQYYISLSNILCCGKEKKFEKINDWEKSQGFTCSALLSGAYLNMGIMDYKGNVEGILPGNFSNEKPIELNEPFSLGPEIILDFSS